MQPALETERFYFAGQPQHRLAILCALAIANGYTQPFARFRIDNLDVAGESLSVELAAAKNLHGCQIHRGGSEHSKPARDRVEQHQEVGNDKHLPGTPNREELGRERTREIELPAGLEILKAARKLDDPMAPVDERRIHLCPLAAEHAQHHAIAAGQRDVGERERGQHCGLELAVARRKPHRRTRIDEDVGEQVFLFLEKLDVEFVAAPVESPIDVAEVVARRVMAIVVELERRAALGRQVHAPPQPGIALAGSDPELFEPGKKSRRKLIRQSEHCYVRGFLSRFITCSRIDSEVTLSASAWKLSNRRWRRHGTIASSMSS